MLRASHRVVFFTLFSFIFSAHAAPNVAEILHNSSPSIVVVQSIQWKKIKVPEQYKGVTQDPVYQVFSRIFNDSTAPSSTPDAALVVKKKTQGSGFIIAPNGIIVTNYQTVVNANELYVQLSDKRRFKATLIRNEPKRDLAILKIATNNLPALPLAHQVSEGEWVIAVGANKAGASAGTVISSGGAQGLLTDVAISPSNTGGPLLNTRGEALAMNSNLLKAATGLTHHVLVGKLVSAKDIEAELPKSWQYLGFTATDVTETILKQQSLPDATGAWVKSVKEGSIASKSGLQQGDVIVTLESQRVVDVSDLNALRDFLSQDNEVNLTVIRAGDRKILRFVIPKTTNAFDEANQHSWQKLGLKVRAMSPAQKVALKVSSGLQITAIQNAAAKVGLNAGDYVLSINQQELKSVEQLNTVAQSLHAGETAFIYISQGEVRQFVGLNIE